MAQPEEWHHQEADAVCRALGSDPEKGLDEAGLEKARARYGANLLTQSSGDGPVKRFLLQMHQPLVYILNVSALVSALLGEWVDAGVIFGVVLVNAVVGFLQESRALSAIEALARVMVSEATVVRGGRKQRVSSEELVPGDLVLLQSGDKVGADMRLLETHELRIEEAALTGESVASDKRPTVLAQDVVLADRANMAYAGTFVTYGKGKGLVVATGDHSEIGKISQMLAAEEILDTPLTRKMATFSMVLLYAIVGLALVTFAVGVFKGETWFDMLMAAVALAVGAIPEGLPAAMTITLAIGVARMAKRAAIIRKLPAVETLGSTTVICSDKTGTLTTNQMTVRRVITHARELEVTGRGYAPEGDFREGERTAKPEEDRAALWMLRAGVLCNDAVLRKDEQGYVVEGDPTEGALLSAAAKAGLDPEQLDASVQRLDQIPFESEYKYMATLHEDEEGRYIVVKGASDALLSRCSGIMTADGKETELDTAWCDERIAAQSDQGLRVLTFAYKRLPGKDSVEHEDLEELTLLGFQVMSDPPRKEAMDAVAACRKAGIRVKMITGDHARTAAAIAREVGLFDEGEQVEVLTGSELKQLDEQQLADRVEQVHVYARVAPEQKLMLVKALQAHGHVVAMTGDGVNDAPALRRGDIGVAMGVTGTEVAREAADMVLTDDNFASIEAAVEEGRGVLDNLIKFITWTLPTNIGMGLVILAAIFAGAALPILPVQILWINMTTVVLLGLTLAFEPLEPGIMTRAPREPDHPILDGPLMFRIVLVGVLLLIGSFGLFQWSLAQGMSEAEARTVAANVFVFGELFYLFNCRSLTHSMFHVGLFSNRLLWWGCLLMALLQVAYTYLPVMNRLFESAPIGWLSWAAILATSLVIHIIIGIEKGIRKARGNSGHDQLTSS